MRVLVLGGTGAFGSRLVEGLVRRTTLGVVIAARDVARAEVLATRLRSEHPGRDIAALRLDAREATAEALRATGAAVLVDAAGPWQGADYRLPRAALAAGMHVVDLADARDYVAGFGAALDEAARAAGRLALTGASSTPALSNAVLDEMLRGWRQVDAIEVAISPGNRAPRGHSVVAAILSYAGRPVRVFTDGAWAERPGWGLTARRRFDEAGWRRVGLCETPDLDILPARFAVRRSALFRAGLELGVLHRGLWLASLAVRAGLLRSLRPFAGVARWIADRFRRFGSDAGGMLVEARGLDAEGRTAEARWVLVAEAGDGPVIPTLPALAVVRALAEGRLVQPGAGPCAGTLPLCDITREFAPYRIAHRMAHDAPAPLFTVAMGEAAFAALPAPIRRLHSPGWWLRASGMAEVAGPEGVFGRLSALLIGLPRRPGPVPVSVTFERTPNGERWTRDFGGRRFASHLSPRPGGGLCERFGPIAFDLALPSDGDGLRMEVVGWRAFGLRMPRALAPVSLASESVDEAGRFRFDVEIRLPLGLGRVVRYQGWLVADSLDGPAASHPTQPSDASRCSS